MQPFLRSVAQLVSLVVAQVVAAPVADDAAVAVCCRSRDVSVSGCIAEL